MNIRISGFRVAFAIVFFAMGALAPTSASAAIRCVDAFRQLAGSGAEPAFHEDFGDGVYLQKISSKEFRIEPPPNVFTSLRDTQKYLAKLAKDSPDKPFTVLFANVSEREAHAFRLMLQRDAAVQADERLSLILFADQLGKDALSNAANYEVVRDRAIQARELLLRRYNWGKASVEAVPRADASNTESYLLTVPQQVRSDSFLLTIYLKAKARAMNRAAAISRAIADPVYENATPEQFAQAGGALCGAQGDVVHRQRQSFHLVQNQGL